MTNVKIPADFPRELSQTALAGVQPKLSVRLENGRYVSGLTPEERTERYLVCADLVEQLLAYCKRKGAEHPDWEQEVLLNRVEQGIRKKQFEWDLASAEVEWIISRVRSGQAPVRRTPTN